MSERGSVTIYALIAGFALCLATLIGSQVASLVALQHRVSAAADLAAIAATKAAVDGEDGCTQARSVAKHNGAPLSRCVMDFEVATVTARGVSKAIWGQRFAVERKARAAPEDYLD